MLTHSCTALLTGFFVSENEEKRGKEKINSVDHKQLLAAEKELEEEEEKEEEDVEVEEEVEIEVEVESDCDSQSRDEKALTEDNDGTYDRTYGYQ